MNMKPLYGKLVAMASFATLFASAAFAQTGDWDLQCIDPDTDPNTPVYVGYGVEYVGNQLFQNVAGISGYVIYGDVGNPDDNFPCYQATHNMQITGRFAFAYGTEGSVQDQSPADLANSSFSDDNMTLTFGFPSPIGSYHMVIVDGAQTFLGANGYSLAFTGASNRYYVLETTINGIFIHITGLVVGDAGVLDWTFRNTDTDSHTVGVWYGSKIGMLTDNEGTTDRNGASWVGTATLESGLNGGRQFKDAYAYLPNTRPPRVDTRYVRATDPANFPNSVDILFGQTAAAGLKVLNGPDSSTTDPKTGQSDVSQADELVLGSAFFLMGLDWTDPPTMPDFIFGDTLTLQDLAYIQKYPETPVPGNNGTKKFVQFFRSTWGVSNYVKPYSIVVDAPKLVAFDNSGSQGSQNGLRPNPMTIRVYVDNFNYAEVNKEIALNDVRITLNLPQGFQMSNGESNVRVISQVLPLDVKFVDFTVETDGQVYGDLPWSVTVNDPITQSPRTLTGSIQVATTPKLNLLAGANLITLPWDFGDTSIESILSPLTTPADFIAYRYDPVSQGYVVATSVERGKSYWIVANNDYPYTPLSSNPQIPADIALGFLQINLKSGWNMIGNPYPYPISIGQLVGVTASNPGNAYTWAELVQQGVVSGFLAQYDTTTGDYTYIQGSDSLLQPNTGYWVYVGTLQDVTVSYPAVFYPAMPGSARSYNEKWVQSNEHWRLMFSARTATSLDGQNYIGRVKTAADAKSNTVLEPPTAYGHKVQLSIEETASGKTTRLAQALTDSSARKAWKVVVTAQEAGNVTLNWPNLSTVPRNVQFRLIDTATGESRNLRQTSGYTYNATEGSTRVFSLEVTSGTSFTKPVIGNVVVSGGGRSLGSPFSISYTLSNEANTTVRILSSAGKEIYTASRGRADRAGENTVSWALRDNANRLVAPGAYRAEILAETTDGIRVRRVIPLNVVR